MKIEIIIKIIYMNIHVYTYYTLATAMYLTIQIKCNNQ
jgi:hypothetical protein